MIYLKYAVLILLMTTVCEIASHASVSSLNVVFHDQNLLSLNFDEMKRKKTVSFNEKVPGETQGQAFQGTNLSTLLENWVKKLSPEKRATIDLVILKVEKGTEILIPRSFFVKYPVYLVADATAGFRTIVPWSSKPRMKDENLPLEKYFAAGITAIEFSSYRERYSWAFLEKKSEPAVLRGEKLFVQNCLSCHGTADKDARSLGSVFSTERFKALDGKTHPVASEFKFNSGHVRAIQLYWQSQLKQLEGKNGS